MHDSAQGNPPEYREWLQKLPVNFNLLHVTGPRSNDRENAIFIANKVTYTYKTSKRSQVLEEEEFSGTNHRTA